MISKPHKVRMVEPTQVVCGFVITVILACVITTGVTLNDYMDMLQESLAVKQKLATLVSACEERDLLMVDGKIYVCTDVTEQVLAANGGETILKGE